MAGHTATVNSSPVAAAPLGLHTVTCGLTVGGGGGAVPPTVGVWLRNSTVGHLAHCLTTAASRPLRRATGQTTEQRQHSISWSRRWPARPKRKHLSLRPRIGQFLPLSDRLAGWLSDCQTELLADYLTVNIVAAEGGQPVIAAGLAGESRYFHLQKQSGCLIDFTKN